MRTSPRGRPATAAPETPSRHARPPPSLARRGCVRTPSPGFHEHGRRPRRGGGPFSHHDKNLRRCPWFEAPDGRPSKRDCRQPTTFHVVVATSNAVVRPHGRRSVAPRRRRPGQRGWHRACGHVPEALPPCPAAATRALAPTAAPSSLAAASVAVTPRPFLQDAAEASPAPRGCRTRSSFPPTSQ